MNSIPSVIAEGGLRRAFLANLFTCIVASICSLMLLKSMTFIPHNSNFQQRIEYNTLVKYYLSDFYFKIISFLHYIGDFCTIVCGIITFSKLVDMLFIKSFGFTLALQLYPRFSLGRVGPDLFAYIYETTDSSRPFGVICITLGYVICTLICTKLSCSSLEETTRFHVTSFLILLGCSVQLCVYSVFSLRGGSQKGFRGLLGGLLVPDSQNYATDGLNVPRSRVGSWLRGGGLGRFTLRRPIADTNRTRNSTCNSVVGNPLNVAHNPLKDTLNQSNSLKAASALRRKGFLEILLTFVDNYSLASTLPSWANEMTNQVSPTKTIWLSSLFAFFAYLVLGLLFSKTFSTLGSTSILDDILNSSYNLLVNFSISLFVIVTSIPDVVFGCISLRYNLLNLGYLNSKYSYFWGCVFPFIFTWLLVNDNLFQTYLGNLGLISALICDFFVPVLLYTVAYSRDYSDFTKVRRTSKLEIVSGWLSSRLDSVYSTTGTLYHRINTLYNNVYNRLLSVVSSFSSASYKSRTNDLTKSGPKNDSTDLDRLEKSESSTTISSGSNESTYTRGDTGTSTSSTDTTTVIERGVSAMERSEEMDRGVDRSGSKDSTSSTATKDSSNFSTFSAFLSRESFLSNRLFSYSNRLFSGTNRLLGTRFSKSISFGSLGRSFSSIFNRRGTGLTNFSEHGLAKSGSKDSTCTSELTKNMHSRRESREVSGLSSLGGKFTKSISFTFGNRFPTVSHRFSIVSHKLSGKFTNRLTTSGTEASINSINTSLSKGLSKGLSTSLSGTISNSLGTSLSSGLRTTGKFSKNLRKTITANLSKSFARNFVSTTEVMLGQGTLETSAEADPACEGSSSASRADGNYVNGSSELTGSRDYDATSSHQQSTKKTAINTDGGPGTGLSGTAASEGYEGKSDMNLKSHSEAGDRLPVATANDNLFSEVDYKSFKIIRNSDDFRKTHDDLFNAVNRPSKLPAANTFGCSGASPLVSSSDATKNNHGNGTGFGGVGLPSSGAKDSHSRHNATGKRDKHVSTVGKERVVVFPRILLRYHLTIAKLMMVLISTLTLVAPGLHLLVARG